VIGKVRKAVGTAGLLCMDRDGGSERMMGGLDRGSVGG